jgi:hypothetical protein
MKLHFCNLLQSAAALAALSTHAYADDADAPRPNKLRGLNGLFGGNGNQGNGNPNPKVHPAGGKPIPGQYLVLFDDKTQQEEVEPRANALMAANGGKRKGKLITRLGKAFVVEMNEGQANAMAKNPNVKVRTSIMCISSML